MKAIATVHRHTDDPAWSDGYNVIVLNDEGQAVGDYSAGANEHDSQAPGSAAVTTCSRWARTTAEQMFQEKFGRPPRPDEIQVDVE